MTSYFAGRELWTLFLSVPLSLFGVSGIQDSTRGSLPTSKSFRGSLPLLCLRDQTLVSTDARVRCSTITISGHEPREMLISRKISDGAPLLCAASALRGERHLRWQLADENAKLIFDFIPPVEVRSIREVSTRACEFRPGTRNIHRVFTVTVFSFSFFLFFFSFFFFGSPAFHRWHSIGFRNEFRSQIA